MSSSESIYNSLCCSFVNLFPNSVRLICILEGPVSFTRSLLSSSLLRVIEYPGQGTFQGNGYLVPVSHQMSEMCLHKSRGAGKWRQLNSQHILRRTEGQTELLQKYSNQWIIIEIIHPSLSSLCTLISNIVRVIGRESNRFWVLCEGRGFNNLVLSPSLVHIIHTSASAPVHLVAHVQCSLPTKPSYKSDGISQFALYLC